MPSCIGRWQGLLAHSARPASGQETGSVVLCPICPKRSVPCWRRRPWARHGHLVHRISACRAYWTDLARSRPEYCSARMVTSITARRMTLWRSCVRFNKACRHWSTPWSCLFSRTIPTCHGYLALWQSMSSALPRRRLILSICPLITRFTSCIRQEPPACPSVLSTVLAGLCCSTSRSSSCT